MTVSLRNQYLLFYEAGTTVDSAGFPANRYNAVFYRWGRVGMPSGRQIAFAESTEFKADVVISIVDDTNFTTQNLLCQDVQTGELYLINATDRIRQRGQLLLFGQRVDKAKYVLTNTTNIATVTIIEG